MFSLDNEDSTPPREELTGDMTTFDNYEKDQQRLLERIQKARRSMIDAELENKRKGDIVNAIMQEKAEVPGLKERVAALENTDPDLWKYIRRLEYIDKQIRCANCGDFRTTPVVNGKIGEGLVTEASGPLAPAADKTSTKISADELKVIVDAKMAEIRNTINVQLFQLEKKTRAELALAFGLESLQ